MNATYLLSYFVRRKMPRIEWNDKKFLAEIKGNVEALEKEGAEIVAKTARETTAFKDQTGALRRSIRTEKSKFKDGGHLVKAGGKGEWGDARHFVPVELGHGGKNPAPAHPFLRPALENNKNRLRTLFEAK